MGSLYNKRGKKVQWGLIVLHTSHISSFIYHFCTLLFCKNNLHLHFAGGTVSENSCQLFKT